MPRRRAVNGPTVTSLLTRASNNAPWNPTIGPLPAIKPPIVSQPWPFASGTSLASLSGVAPALPAQFFTRTLPAASSVLNGNATVNLGTAQDAIMRAFNSIQMRFFGMKEAT